MSGAAEPTPVWAKRIEGSHHFAALCRGCGTAFVVHTLPPGGQDLTIWAKRIEGACCPECGAKGSEPGFGLARGPEHARAVERLRRDAALP